MNINLLTILGSALVIVNIIIFIFGKDGINSKLSRKGRIFIFVGAFVVALVLFIIGQQGESRDGVSDLPVDSISTSSSPLETTSKIPTYPFYSMIPDFGAIYSNVPTVTVYGSQGWNGVCCSVDKNKRLFYGNDTFINKYEGSIPLST